MDRPVSKFWGILSRRERWGLSWRGSVLVVMVISLAGLIFLLRVQPFLAVTHRVPANILVVEGWVHAYGVDAAVKEFRTGHYRQIYTTGGPVEGIGPTSSIYDTEAHRTAGLLKLAGIPAENVQSVPATYVGKDRTYTSAMVLRNWLRDHGVQVAGINVLTEDAHARRSWLLFSKAMGSMTRVGIISVSSPDYDPDHWWRTSEGVREMIDEGIAYLYAKIFFWPPAVDQK